MSDTDVFLPVAVLFDLDGTLIDGYDAIVASVNHLRAHRGLEPLCAAEVRASVGNGVFRLLEITCPVGDLQDNHAFFMDHHVSAIREGTRALDDVPTVLATLQSRGFRLGVCSNKPVMLTRRILANLGLLEAMDVVLGPESVPRRKPAPDMLLAASERLGLPTARVLYVGDMAIDIEAARAAGVAVWVVSTGSHSKDVLKAAGPDRLMDRFTDLLELPAPRRQRSAKASRS